MDFSGRIAVITGGASGIGAACATMLAERGARIIVADRDLDRAKALAASLGATAISLDVGRRGANEDAAAEIEATIGPVEILVTSAGILQRPLPPEELGEAEIEDVTRVDQLGTYYSAAAFGARMARRGRGSIIAIASIAGSRSMPLHAYAPAKAAVIAIARDLAAEWGASGVRVNSVSPGFTLTRALIAQIAAGQRDPALLAATSAMGRAVRMEEVAEAVCFLASDAASGITGIDLPVDAGWLVAGSWASYGGLPAARGNAGARPAEAPSSEG